MQEIVRNLESFIKKANIVHNNRFDYSKTTYISTHTETIVICKEHGEFITKPSLHLAGVNCPQCGKQSYKDKRNYTQEEFLEKAKLVHGDYYDYNNSVYVNKEHKIKITCPKHGEIIQSAGEHMRGRGCNECGNIRSGEKQSKGFDYFLKRANETHGYSSYTYYPDEYIGMNQKIRINCVKHGEFIQNAGSHVHRQGCKQCALDNVRQTKDKMIETAIKNYGSTYDYSLIPEGVLENKKKYTFICENGHHVQQKPTHHINNGNQCAICNKPKMGKWNLSTQEEIIDKFKAKHGDTYDYSKVNYISTDFKVEIICDKHGSFLQKPHSHSSGSGCPKCNTPISQIEWIKSFNNPNLKMNETLNVSGRTYFPDGIDYTTNTMNIMVIIGMEIQYIFYLMKLVHIKIEVILNYIKRLVIEGEIYC